MSHETTWTRNTTGIQASAAHRKASTFARSDAAIDALNLAGQAVNFQTVAKEAQVTTAYLYKHSALRSRIEALRTQQADHTVRRRQTRSGQSKTDAAKNLLLLAKERRIRELEEEVRRLKRELQVALGKLYERV